MKIRHLIAGVFLLLELPILLPFVVGAVLTGLFYGVQMAGERARALLASHHRQASRERLRSLVRPAVS